MNTSGRDMRRARNRVKRRKVVEQLTVVKEVIDEVKPTFNAMMDFMGEKKLWTQFRAWQKKREEGEEDFDYKEWAHNNPPEPGDLKPALNRRQQVVQANRDAMHKRAEKRKHEQVEKSLRRQQVQNSLNLRDDADVIDFTIQLGLKHLQAYDESRPLYEALGDAFIMQCEKVKGLYLQGKISGTQLEYLESKIGKNLFPQGIPEQGD